MKDFLGDIAAVETAAGDHCSAGSGNLVKSACITVLVALTLFTVACTTPVQKSAVDVNQPGRDPDRLLVVDCLLPGQLRRLGRSITFMTPRRPTKVSASECEIRGGEYVAYDRANFATSLRVWLPKAESGDPEAQTFVGEIFEKGLGQIADAVVAAEWYRRAAEQGYSRAMINLGYLYESGLGVEQDLAKAMNFYRQAAGFGDSQLEYVTSIQIAARKKQNDEFPIVLKQLEEANQRLDSERLAFATLENDFRKLKKETEQARKKIASARPRTTKAFKADAPDQAKIGVLLTDMSGLKGQLVNSENDLTRVQQELKAQQLDTGLLRKQLSAATNELDQAQDDLATQTGQIASLEKLLVEQREAATGTANTQIKSMENQLAQSVASRDGLVAQIEQLKAKQSTSTKQLSVQLQVAEARERSLVSDLEQSRNNISQLQLTLAKKDASYQQQIDVLGKSQIGLQTRIGKQQGKISSLEQEIARLEKQSREQQSADTSALQENISQLQQQLSAAEADLIVAQQEKPEDDAPTLAQLAELESALQDQERLLNARHKKIGTLQKELLTLQSKEEGPQIEQVGQTITVGPRIEIIDPPVTAFNGGLAIPVSAASGVINLIGQVSPAENLISFRVNGGSQKFNDNGVFQHEATIDSSTKLSLAAVDNAGARAALEVTLVKDQATSAANNKRGTATVDVSQVDFGEYHALIIGNSQYRSMPEIDTAVLDATAISTVLENRFGFKTELLLDADRYDILSALNRKRDELSRQDNLIIYFAGHGETGNGQGYWLPVDADPGDKSSWISNVALTGLVDSMNAKHVMVIADSVFSGTLSRSSLIRMGSSMDADERLRFYELASNSIVRTVLTSGANQPVADSANGGNSVFASSLIRALSAKSAGVMPAHDLFVKIRRQLESMDSSAMSAKLPQYAPIQYAGHENGEFLFVPLDNQIGLVSDDPVPERADRQHGS